MQQYPEFRINLAIQTLKRLKRSHKIFIKSIKHKHDKYSTETIILFTNFVLEINKLINKLAVEIKSLKN